MSPTMLPPPPDTDPDLPHEPETDDELWYAVTETARITMVPDGNA